MTSRRVDRGGAVPVLASPRAAAAAAPRPAAARTRSGAPPLAVEEPGAAYLVTKRLARALLDVNVLIALLDTDHLHHRRASAWLADNIAAGWASCATTQNGCVRIMSQPGYPNALPVSQVAFRLAAATRTEYHAFIDDAPSLLDDRYFDSEQLLGHRQVTDAWLLGLAVRHGLRLVTFDGAMPMRVVRGAEPGHLVTL